MSDKEMIPYLIITSDLIGAWEVKIMTDQPTDHPTYRQADGLKVKFHFQSYI